MPCSQSHRLASAGRQLLGRQRLVSHRAMIYEQNDLQTLASSRRTRRLPLVHHWQKAPATQRRHVWNTVSQCRRAANERSAFSHCGVSLQYAFARRRPASMSTRLPPPCPFRKAPPTSLCSGTADHNDQPFGLRGMLLDVRTPTPLTRPKSMRIRARSLTTAYRLSAGVNLTR